MTLWREICIVATILVKACTLKIPWRDNSRACGVKLGHLRHSEERCDVNDSDLHSLKESVRISANSSM